MSGTCDSFSWLGHLVRQWYPSRGKCHPVQSGDLHATAAAYSQTNGYLWLWDWHPILDWSHAAVFAFLRERVQQLYEAYTRYGCSRVSCAFCVLSSASDLVAASRCKDNQNVYLQLVELEAESSFSFQPNRWLGDVAPQLLPSALSGRLEHAKEVARRRKFLEAQIPDDLLLREGMPGRIPTASEAGLLSSIRYEVSKLLGFPLKYLETDEIMERYRLLLAGIAG